MFNDQYGYGYGYNNRGLSGKGKKGEKVKWLKTTW